MKIPISAVLITKNEEEHLADCLAVLHWVDEIVVVDSLSTDRTEQIAREMGARFVEHPFRNYADQRNFAHQQATHDWVLVVDADERIPLALAEEIMALAEAGALAENNAYHIRRVDVKLGEWFGEREQELTPEIREGIRQSETPRLYDRRLAVWSRPLHETVDVPEPHGVLAGRIYHFSSTNLSRAYDALNSYTDIEAAHLYHQNPRRIHILEMLFRGLRNTLFLYFYWRWWRHGKAGLHMAIASGFAKYLNYAKADDLARIAAGEGEITAPDRALLARALEVAATSAEQAEVSEESVDATKTDHSPSEHGQ